MARKALAKLWKTRVLMFLAVLGPGFITANVDNDTGGILTYSQAGAHFGYSMLWSMLPITIALIVVQEMCARMGVVTGKGLSDLIREEFGLRMTFVVMALLVVVNYSNVVSEFSGIAGSMQLFHLSKYVSVPVCAVLVWFLVVRGDYKIVEKIFLFACLVYFAYIITGVLAGPAWREALVQTVKPPAMNVWRQDGYVYLVIGLVGTTIAPWMQFYLQSSVVEKGISVKQYAASRLDVVFGCFVTDIVAWFIIVACAATMYVHGMTNINVASDAAEAMKPLAGQYAFILFAVGLFNASIFSASILPLSTAYTVCEGLGFESGVDKKFGEAKFFYWFYTLLIAAGSAVVLIPNFPLVKVIILSQVLNGILLPVVLIFMIRLINREELMGRHVNKRWMNVTAWATSTIVIVLSVALMYITLFPPKNS
jgi:NRAMP (natural resistance-associated macrophage protein)-like metal ion transporter